MFQSYFFSFVLFLSTCFVFATPPEKQISVHTHMCEINENWKKIDNKNFLETVSYESEIERIQHHLLLVEKTLRASNSELRTTIQSKNRLRALDILRRYALRKEFPSNIGHSVRQPYFIDNFGTHCAVGFLIKETGFSSISTQVAETQNFAYVREILSPELVKWSVDYGFTLEELAWIQPSYPPAQQMSSVDGGTDGWVVCSKTSNSGDGFSFGGTFTTIGAVPCKNVGFYSGTQYSCYGSGVNGKVIYAAGNSSTVLLAGRLEYNDSIYPMAYFNGVDWEYRSIPGRPNAEATACGYNDVAIIDPSDPAKQEIWGKVNGNWELQGKLTGRIFVLGQSTGRVYGGDFDSIELRPWNGIPWQTYVSKNIVYEPIGLNSFTVQTVQGPVPDVVKCWADLGLVYYCGGSHAFPNSDRTVLSRIQGGYALSAIDPGYLHDNSFGSVNAIEFDGAGKLILAGSLQSHPWAMYFGKFLARYDMALGYLEFLGNMNNIAHTVNKINNTIYVGGAFSTYPGMSPLPVNLNYLAKLDGTLSTPEIELKVLTLFPNPGSSQLKIKGIQQQQIETIEVTDLQGRVVLESKEIEIPTENFPSGVYSVRITTVSGSQKTLRWVRE